jgi:DNA replicative helicase MCM subunit Mcm2 (Cdc46/Mcm family)
MMSFKSFSQSVTDTSKIQLTRPIAKAAIIDILQGDNAKEQIKLLENIKSELETKSLTQVILVNNLTTQITNYKSIIVDKDLQIENHIKISETYKKAYQKEKRSKLLWKLATGAAIATGIIIQL